MRPLVDVNLIGLGLDPRTAFARAGSAFGRTPWRAWREVPPNAPRMEWDHATGRLLGALFETQRVNGFPNPRAEGGTIGTIGSGGVLPTGYVRPNSAASVGVLVEVLGAVTVDGRPGLRIRYHTNGVATTGAATESIEFAVRASAPAASPSQPAALTLGMRLHAGVVSTLNSASTRLLFLNASGGAVAGNSFTGSNVRDVLSPTLLQAQQVATATADAAVARGTGGVQIGFATGVVYDFTIDLIAPQLEVGASYPTSTSLPAAGAPGASTRPEDVLTTALADWGVPAGLTAGTLLLACRAAPGAGAADLHGVSVDDGTSSNAVRIVRQTGRALRAEVVSGGSTLISAGPAGVVADGADIVVAVAYAPGDLAISLNGAVPVTAAPASIPAGLARLRLGGWDGAVARAAWWPRRLTNADLQTIAA